MPKGAKGKGRRKKGGGKKRNGSGSRGAPSDGYDAIPDTTFDEFGRTLCAEHHLETCHICCMSFIDQNREIDENPGDRDVGVFISEAALVEWHAKMQVKMPQVFPESDKVFGSHPGQHSYGTKLLNYFDDDKSKPMNATVVGSRWKKDEFDLPGMTSYWADGREPHYVILMHGGLSEIGFFDAHPNDGEEGGWEMVGRDAAVNPRLDALAQAHARICTSDGDCEGSGSDDDSSDDASIAQTNNCIRRTLKLLQQQGDLPMEPWDESTHGDFLEQFFAYNFSPEEQELIMNCANENHNRDGIAEAIKAVPIDAASTHKRNFYARVLMVQLVVFYLCDRYGGVILQNARQTKFQAIEFSSCCLGPDSVPMVEITYATDPEGIERPTGYLRGETIKIVEVSNDLAVALEEHLLNCVANEGLNDLSGLLYHEGFLLPMAIISETAAGSSASTGFANAQTPDVNFGVELELSCASGNYMSNFAPSLEQHANINVVRSERSGKGEKGGVAQGGFFFQQKGSSKESDRSASKHDKWKLVYDKSISANEQNPHSALFELVSPILSGNAGLDLLSNVVNATTDVACVRVNDSMGSHVHVEAKSLRLQSMKCICQQFLLYEEVIDSFLPPHRRTGSEKSHSYFESNLLSMMASYDTLEGSLEAIEACQSRDELYNDMNPGVRERYHKMNLQNLKTGRQLTIEFRQHHATKDAIEIVAWARFCVLFVANAATMPVLDGSIPSDASFDNMFANIIKCPALKEYYSRKVREYQRD